MSLQSAVQFPGNFRLHVALNVTDIEKSKAFYQVLLGCAPSKERARYAKFEPTDPSVNLTLNEVEEAFQVEGGSAHFGVQVKSVVDVHAALERFQNTGIETITEEATTCCYAVQDKVWAVDPDGHKWEVFCVLEADAKDELYAQAGCCGPDMVSFGSCEA
ncbi:ArsI/CadI family heavy metal resistance metalloenzyme [Thalassoglobus sp. JC818]|uniref:ArsI/CadI family heavy metal resistance metalloenzyme n=1 Tax=Thalassoglobus sp. JC818 TaxID=3232136 RepID=UPI00345A5085